MDTVVEFRNVSKSFSYLPGRPTSLKSLFISMAKGSYFALQREKKVVLDDVSFKIQRGEVVGIMGRNGTGKSTLLRILSGIYQPDSGEVVVKERIAPLVALGAGLHGDLSGYENIFLNSAILGIPRSAIFRLLPAIIDFSELGNQIYHPVKTYSSGMVLRLGFSIASHVDAPIVILDEVLGVGDEGFQTKCYRKLEEMFGSGRTIILVTHDPLQIQKFCKRCMLLENGKVIYDGPAGGGAQRYSELFGAAPMN
jgi:ABC-type polysaccharide/polyol phosphate transport system ATPase subunit